MSSHQVQTFPFRIYSYFCQTAYDIAHYGQFSIQFCKEFPPRQYILANLALAAA